ncbi:restriction endonuclease subunit S, partial [Treponema sp.]|uniref:restriction endonuclease subunit S n=1 Tax=Treponema sp. TaxID=166 RepID=UPI00298D88E5
EKFAMLETVKANAKANLQNAKDLFQSQLTKAFSNTTWEKKRLGEVAELISGYAFESKKYSTDENDTLLVCGDNIMHCSFRWETIKRWPKNEYEELKRFELKDSDIVLAMDRPWIKSGLKISKITENELPSLLVQRTAAIRTENKNLSSYLYYALQEDNFSKYLIDQQTGVGVPHISGKQILNYEIRFPLSPNTRSEDLELRGIVEQLDSLSEKVRSLEEIYTKQLANCDELKQAFLEKAFAGEL